MVRLNFGRLLMAELRRSWELRRRYPVELFGAIAIAITVFYGLFLGARYVAGSALPLGDRFDAIVIGYVLWTLVIGILIDVANSLQYEAQTGTLEQLFLSPFGAPAIFLARAIANLTIQVVLNLVILLAIMALTGSRLAFPPLLILPLAAVFASTYGLAFLMGSLTLLFKRVQQIFGITQFLLLFLMATPTETWTGWGQVGRWLLPMTGGAGLLRDLMARQVGLNWGELALAAVNGLVYLSFGAWLFRISIRLAKQRGKLSSY
ncbi:MAG: ABC transporter permease [Spirulinaceae cyanobacterium SM2_1_0]|nr:ABC transporter permease [Spirulinaceae cyanobacterium SM2_1_0]